MSIARQRHKIFYFHKLEYRGIERESFVGITPWYRCSGYNTNHIYLSINHLAAAHYNFLAVGLSRESIS